MYQITREDAEKFARTTPVKPFTNTNIGRMDLYTRFKRRKMAPPPIHALGARAFLQPAQPNGDRYVSYQWGWYEGVFVVLVEDLPYRGRVRTSVAYRVPAAKVEAKMKRLAAKEHKNNVK